MTKQQEYRAFVKMLKEFPKAFGRVSFRERLMLRTAFSYVVEEVVADIKANCDLAIEGRDVKIKELEEQNSEMFITIALQEQQIEQMKCCGNCKHFNKLYNRCELTRLTLKSCLCNALDKWEIEK